MTACFKLRIEYDGTDFFGWQRQADQPTIQEEIETALSKIMNRTIRISGSGRTDAGVHALGQTASFQANTRLLPGQIKKALNSLIKSEIVILDCHRTAPDFHAQYSARSKTYQYRILNRPTPCAVGRRYCWHIRTPLDVREMNQCCEKLIGTFDFKSFENTGSPRTSTIRQILHARVEKEPGDQIVFEIRATGFLKYMVRNITGTLVLAGQNRISPGDFEKIIHARDRQAAGPTAPPQGLFLMKVDY